MSFFSKIPISLRQSWLPIALLAIVNFMFIYVAGEGNNSILLPVEAILLFLICAYAIGLSNRKNKLEQQLVIHQRNGIEKLTGLFTKKSFTEKSISAVVNALEAKDQLSLIRMDIDNLKSYYERFGADAGDEVIQRIAVVIQESIHSLDFAARFSDNEFCVLLPNSSAAEAVALAKKFHAEVSRIIHEKNGEKVNLTISIGVSCLSQTVTSIESLLAKSGHCLRDAKRSGGNQVIADYDATQVQGA